MDAQFPDGADEEIDPDIGMRSRAIQKIRPHLWFDTEAKDATEFYASAFHNSKISNVTTQHDTPSGDCDVVSFSLSGQPFMAISAGPYFKFNPSISFHVKCKTKNEVNTLWKKFSAGGSVLMELGKYPWSEKYGWLADKYGLSWQIFFVGDSPIEQKITPVLMFVGAQYGKAEEAVNFYASVFSGRPGRDHSSSGQKAKVDILSRYGAHEEPDKKGRVKYATLTLEGAEFGATESAHEHKFAFNEAISFMVYCDTQSEIDYFWEKLSAVPESDLPAPRPDIFYVYAILCGDNSIYIGQTQDLITRWRQHEAGIATEHTRRHKPLRMIHFEEFSTRDEVVKREHDLKTGFGRKWLKREFKAGRTRQAGQCGWLKDKYGVSWQVVPTQMDEMMTKGTQKQIAQVTEAFLKMKKFDIATLKKEYETN